MNAVKIQKLLNEIAKADLVTVDDSPYLDISNIVIAKAKNEKTHVVLQFNWKAKEGDNQFVDITELGLADVVIRNNIIECRDEDDWEVLITLYDLKTHKINMKGKK